MVTAVAGDLPEHIIVSKAITRFFMYETTVQSVVYVTMRERYIYIRNTYFFLFNVREST